MQPVSPEAPVDRALLVGVYSSRIDPEPRLDELASLVDAARAVPVHRIVQRRPHNVADDRPLHPATYVGKGKVEEIKEAVEDHEANVVVFDHELGPAQVRELEKRLGCRVVDRSEVILDIFATRAQTRQARLQVELAQLQYTAPRLRGMWSHLARQAGQSGGGGIATRGPGEKQLEIDRRIVSERIKLLQEELSKIGARKERQVEARTARAWSVGLVGYTNAGKSTLLNALTDSGAFAADQLFATLDTVSRRWEVQPGVAIPLSDTVGFVRDLPHHLVTGFRSTLAEALHASLLLHVVDASHPEALDQVEVVHEVLDDLGVPPSRILGVLNKCDAVDDPNVLLELRERLPDAVAVSALTGLGLDKLAAKVAERRAQDWTELNLDVPPDRTSRLVALVNERGEILSEEWDEEGWHALVRVPDAIVHELRAVVRAE